MPVTTRCILIVAGACVAATACGPRPAATRPAAASAPDTVDRLIAAEMASAHVPGVALAVVRSGTVIKARGYGVGDLENGVPVTAQTVFKIGSVSKQFIAAGIVLLAQDGRLGLDDPIARHLAGTPQSWSGITLRHLLTHTSGVLREGPAFDPMKLQPDSVVIRSAYSAPLEFPTGTKYQYCNVCYFTLADVIARTSGKPWDEFLAERVFRPLGMRATRTTTTTGMVPHRARGYVWRDTGYVNAEEYLAVRPSGAFLSTVADLAKWDAALYGDRVLTKASRDTMWRRVTLSSGGWWDYGFGWFIDSLDGHWRVHHGGSLPGFRAELARFPDDSLTVIVLANADGARPSVMASNVARVYLRKRNTTSTPSGALPKQ